MPFTSTSCQNVRCGLQTAGGHSIPRNETHGITIRKARTHEGDMPNLQVKEMVRPVYR